MLAGHSCWDRMGVVVMGPQGRGDLEYGCPAVLSCWGVAAPHPLDEPTPIHPFPEVSPSQLWAAQGVG